MSPADASGDNAGRPPPPCRPPSRCVLRAREVACPAAGLKRAEAGHGSSSVVCHATLCCGVGRGRPAIELANAGVDPEGANAEGANAEGANAEGTNPEGANLEGAKPKGAARRRVRRSGLSVDSHASPTISTSSAGDAAGSSTTEPSASSTQRVAPPPPRSSPPPPPSPWSSGRGSVAQEEGRDEETEERAVSAQRWRADCRRLRSRHISFRR